MNTKIHATTISSYITESVKDSQAQIADFFLRHPALYEKQMTTK